MLTVYLKSDKTIFLYHEEKIYKYSFDNLSEILEKIVTEHKINKEKVSLILDFTIFYINFFNASGTTSKEEKESLSQFLSQEIENYTDKNFITKQFYLDHPQRKSIILSISREYLTNIQFILKKYNLTLNECKVDMLSIYEYFKNQDISILNLGDNLSFILEIKFHRIEEFKIVTINVDDIENLNNYDFIKNYENLFILSPDIENIEVIFSGNSLYSEPNFLEKNFFYSKKINIKPILPYFIVLLFYFFVNSLISYNNLEVENKKIKEEIDFLQQELLNLRNNNEIDYSKELKELNEIIETMKYQNYYKLFNFLIKESNKNIGFTKIIYDDKFWTIEGEADKFETIEKFEDKLNNYAKNMELNFIKNENSLLIFQYKIGEVLWN